MNEHGRELIFISHATPEDNEFSLWLATKLKLLGYEVWSDVTQLFGGEKWWADIEEAINSYVCKFVIVVTKSSLSKPGVKREIELALAAEKRHDIRNFIIPVMIEDAGFEGLPYGLSERNIIPFFRGWGGALARLKERLVRDGVVASSMLVDMGPVLEGLLRPVLQVEKREDRILSNWLEIQSFPEYLNFFRLPIDPQSWAGLLSDCPYPWFAWREMLVCFADSNAIQNYIPKYIRLAAAPRLSLQSVLESSPRSHGDFSRGEVIKRTNYMISQAWAQHMMALGLRQYGLSGGKAAWFFPDCEKFSGLHEFTDLLGVVKKRKVIGYSQKNKVFWHYAVGISSQFGNYPRITLVPHVVFTEDGESPLEDKRKMHRLRRGFCANWWNDRWRDLLLTYLSMLSRAGATIDVAVGNNEFISFSSRLLLFDSNVSLVDSSEDYLAEQEENDVYVDLSELNL